MLQKNPAAAHGASFVGQSIVDTSRRDVSIFFNSEIVMIHLVIIFIAIALEIGSLFAYGLDSALLPLWAGIAGTLVVSSSMAKVQNDDPDNWEVALQAMGLFIVYYLPLAFSDSLYTWAQSTNNGKLFVALIALAWCGPVWIYFGRPGRHIWPMSFVMGVIVCAFPGAVLYWGFDWADSQKPDMMVGGIFLTAAATAMVIFVELKLMEFLSDLGWFFFNCKVPGSVRYITRGDKLKFQVCNRDGVFRQEGLELPDEWARWLEDGDFTAIQRWKAANGCTDAVVECVDFLLALPGIYVVPLLAKERKLRHPFIGAPEADVEHEAEHPSVFDFNPPSCTLLLVPDVDIRKRTETGMSSREVDQTVGTMLRVSSPSAIFGSHHWEHDVDHAWEGLTSDIARLQGPNIIGFQGPIAALYERRLGFMATLLSIATPDVDGTPELEHSFEHFMGVLRDVGIVSADDRHTLVKSQDEAEVVQAARDAMTRIRAEAVTAPMRAETMRQIQMAQVQAVVDAVNAARLEPAQRGDVLARALTFYFMGDNAGLAQMMSTMGMAGAAFGVGRGAVAPPSGRGGGRGGGGH